MQLRLTFFSGCTVLCLSLLGPTARARAEIVVSTFEESDLQQKLNAYQSYAGEIGQAVPFRSGKVTFANDGVDATWGSWSGVGYSQKADATLNPDQSVTYYQYNNDFVPKLDPAPAQGSGADGSATWGVVYSFGTLTADVGYVFDSLSIANTLWAWDTIANGDPNFPANIAFEAGDFFTVTFTNSATANSVVYDLADFRGPIPSILKGWDSVDVSGLNASQLKVSFSGSRNTDYGLLTPAYVAIDNVAVSSVAAVPEPSSLALMAVGGSLGVWFRWRKRRRS